MAVLPFSIGAISAGPPSSFSFSYPNKHPRREDKLSRIPPSKMATFTLILLVSLVASVTSYSCHICDTDIEDDCNDPFVDDYNDPITTRFIRDCRSTLGTAPRGKRYSHCVKEELFGQNGYKNIKRTCGYGIEKYGSAVSFRKGLKLITFRCKGENCNGSPTNLSGGVLIVLAMAMFVLHFNQFR